MGGVVFFFFTDDGAYDREPLPAVTTTVKPLSSDHPGGGGRGKVKRKRFSKRADPRWVQLPKNKRIFRSSGLKKRCDLASGWPSTRGCTVL